jgi:hypothetical protein
LRIGDLCFRNSIRGAGFPVGGDVDSLDELAQQMFDGTRLSLAERFLHLGGGIVEFAELWELRGGGVEPVDEVGAVCSEFFSSVSEFLDASGAYVSCHGASDVARFADRNRFASWTGTAPLDASSGAQIRHRLSRAGNRRMNHVLHVAAIVQLRHDTEGRVYYRRKIADGKTHMEAMRCLKRRLSDVIYRRLVADAAAAAFTNDEASPGGHCGATQGSSAADLPPHIGTSDKPLPGLAKPTLPATALRRKTSPSARTEIPLLT